MSFIIPILLNVIITLLFTFVASVAYKAYVKGGSKAKNNYITMSLLYALYSGLSVTFFAFYAMFGCYFFSGYGLDFGEEIYFCDVNSRMVQVVIGIVGVFLLGLLKLKGPFKLKEADYS